MSLQSFLVTLSLQAVSAEALGAELNTSPFRELLFSPSFSTSNYSLQTEASGSNAAPQPHVRVLFL